MLTMAERAGAGTILKGDEMIKDSMDTMRETVGPALGNLLDCYWAMDHGGCRAWFEVHKVNRARVFGESVDSHPIRYNLYLMGSEGGRQLEGSFDHHIDAFHAGDLFNHIAMEMAPYS